MALADRSTQPWTRSSARIILALFIAATALILYAWHAPHRRPQSAVAAAPGADNPSPQANAFPDFRLLDSFGNHVSFADLRKKHRLLAVIFWGCECPLVRLYTPTLNQLQEEFGPSGLAVLAINSNVQDSPTMITRFIETEGAHFPILKDVGNVVADQVQAERTPEAYLVSNQGEILYRGRIDDQFGIGYRHAAPKTSFLKQAIQSALVDSTIQKTRTEAVGCIIGRANKPTPRGSITYTKDVARILQEKCAHCHRDGEVAPFSLTRFDQAYGWAEMIREVIEQQRMPPWFADAPLGHFRNDPRLTPEEKKTLLQWIDDGAPEGDPAVVADPSPLVTGWTIPHPDLVLSIADRPVKVPARGPYEYQSFYIDPKLSEDKWIVAAEARPGNRKVVHHIAIWILRDGMARDDYSTSPSIAFAPGMPPLTYPEGAALRLPKDATIRYQIHYEPCGYETEDLSTLGLKFCEPSQVKRQVLIDAIFPNNPIAIPPRDAAYRMEGYHYFARDALLFGLMPHMHLRGKSYRYTLVRPDQSREVLLDLPRWDFGWQFWYLLPQPIHVDRGSLIEAETIFDNSPDNKANPDANQQVHWGPKTTDEMTVGVFAAVDPASEASAQSKYLPPLEGFGAPEKAAWKIDSDNGASAQLIPGPSLYARQRIRIDQPGNKASDLRLSRSVHPVVKGRAYCLQFRVRSNTPRTIRFALRAAGDPSADLGVNESIAVSDQEQVVRREFYVTTNSSDPSIEFQLGSQAGQIELDSVVFLQGFHR
jgi:thiol-disulfide isomerase/thioredoxin